MKIFDTTYNAFLSGKYYNTKYLLHIIEVIHCTKLYHTWKRVKIYDTTYNAILLGKYHNTKYLLHIIEVIHCNKLYHTWFTTLVSILENSRAAYQLRCSIIAPSILSSSLTTIIDITSVLLFSTLACLHPLLKIDCCNSDQSLTPLKIYINLASLSSSTILDIS